MTTDAAEGLHELLEVTHRRAVAGLLHVGLGLPDLDERQAPLFDGLRVCDIHPDHREVGAEGGEPHGGGLRVILRGFERDRPLPLAYSTGERKRLFVPAREGGVRAAHPVQLPPPLLHRRPQCLQAGRVRPGQRLVAAQVDSHGPAVLLLADLPVELIRRLAPSEFDFRHRCPLPSRLVSHEAHWQRSHRPHKRADLGTASHARIIGVGILVVGHQCVDLAGSRQFGEDAGRLPRRAGRWAWT